MAECPQCHFGSLVERRNKKTGQSFYGCDRWPECKFAVRSLDRLSSKSSAPEDAPSASSEPTRATSDELAAAVRELTAEIRALAQSFKGEKSA